MSFDGDLSLGFYDAFADIIAESGPTASIVVDMPIGLSEDGIRPVDALVRERLGPRRSTFFPTPIRSVLDFEDWSEANDHAKRVAGKGLSKQAWNLVPKIAEIDDAWTLEVRDRVLEGHPETSFAELNGEPLTTKKAQPEGQSERLGLLHSALGREVTALVAEFPKKWRVDAIDALVLNWTARRVISRTSIRLGGEPDLLGRPMQLTI